MQDRNINKMNLDSYLLQNIKKTVLSIEPTATVMLYGSCARNEENIHSDIDLLILIDQHSISPITKKNILNHLYQIEFETGKIISPMVVSRNFWEHQHRKNPFYENVCLEAKVL